MGIWNIRVVGAGVLISLMGCLQAPKVIERRVASAPIWSGYFVGDELCGDGEWAFPKVRIGLKQGLCAGLVLSEEDGLKFPRNIIQVPGRNLFIIADMGGWAAGSGRILLLDPSQPRGRRVRVLLNKLDAPHGLGVGRDRKIYVGAANGIFRLKSHDSSEIEWVIRSLPGRVVNLPDGRRIHSNTHVLHPFVFDARGNLFVNVGAHSDNCLDMDPGRECKPGVGSSAMGAIWRFQAPASGVFPTLKPGDKSPAHEVYAVGLRNSMAIAAHPKFPADGYVFMQAENARDLSDPDRPYEEFNIVKKGRHYGWPYCFDRNSVSPEYASFLAKEGPLRNLCTNNRWYEAPISLLPPHAAPLAMHYYDGAMFPEWRGQLLLSLHGYRPTGSRLIMVPTDSAGRPVVKPAPVTYPQSCAPEKNRRYMDPSRRPVNNAAQIDITEEWHRVNGIRPQGAPVGFTVAEDGSIWVVEDKNKTVIRIARENAVSAGFRYPCDQRDESVMNELWQSHERRSSQKQAWTHLRKNWVEKHCMGCHSDFGLKAGMSDAERDRVAFRFLLSQDGWIYPGDGRSGRLYPRVRGLGHEKVMPPADGDALLKRPEYVKMLDQLEAFVNGMVEGRRMLVQRRGGATAPVVSATGRRCGTLLNGQTVILLARGTPGPAGHSRIYRPPDQVLNGTCGDSDGYFVLTASLKAP